MEGYNHKPNKHAISVEKKILWHSMHFPFWPQDLNIGSEPRLMDTTLQFSEKGLYGHQHHASNLSPTFSLYPFIDQPKSTSYIWYTGLGASNAEIFSTLRFLIKFEFVSPNCATKWMFSQTQTHLQVFSQIWDFSQTCVPPTFFQPHLRNKTWDFSENDETGK